MFVRAALLLERNLVRDFPGIEFSDPDKQIFSFQKKKGATSPAALVWAVARQLMEKSKNGREADFRTEARLLQPADFNQEPKCNEGDCGTHGEINPICGCHVDSLSVATNQSRGFRR